MRQDMILTLTIMGFYNFQGHVMIEKRKGTIVVPISVNHEDPLIDSNTEVNSCKLTPFHVLKFLKFAFGYRI